MRNNVNCICTSRHHILVFKHTVHDVSYSFITNALKGRIGQKATEQNQKYPLWFPWDTIAILLIHQANTLHCKHTHTHTQKQLFNHLFPWREAL